MAVFCSAGLQAQNFTYGLSNTNEYGKLTLAQFVVKDDARYASDPTANLTVESMDVPSDFSDQIEAAIQFENTTGNIMNNSVTDCPHTGSTVNAALFQAGIVITSTAAAGTPITKPYFCNNTVKNQISGSSGIQSDHSAGYVNLCILNGNSTGYSSGEKDNPFIVHSSITMNTLDGISIPGSGGSTNVADVDLTGIHSSIPCTTCDDFAANNIITNNGTHSTDAQILIDEKNQSCELGSENSSWGSWGKNKIQASTSTSLFIATSSAVTLGMANVSKLATSFKNIDGNLWVSSGGSAIDPNSLAAPINSNFSVSYVTTAGGAYTLATWTGDSSSHFSCSGYSGGEIINPKGSEPLSVLSSDSDRCLLLQGYENTPPNLDTSGYRIIYDSLRVYIEICGMKDCTVWQAFPHIDAAVQFMSSDTMRFDIYRVWLDSVLFLYPNCPEYFCVAMGSLEGTYQYGKYKGVGTFTIEDYLRKHHPECIGTDSASIARENKQYTKDSLSLVRAGMDPVNLPPLDSIGLGNVLLHDAKLGVSQPSGLTSIKDILLQPNPALESVTASYTLNSQSFVILSLFDALGKTVWEQTGRTEPQGEHNVSIDLHTLPSGTYYVRIRTLGETKTVTLVHEK